MAAQFVAESLGLSQRRASVLTGICRGTCQYQPQPDRDEKLRKRMRELADLKKRGGCRMLHVYLKREGLVVNHKRTERIYGEERLSLRIRKRKKRAAQVRVELPKATRPNELWAMDFVQDAIHNGRKLRLLTMLDTFTKESLKIEIDTSIGGKRVAAVLTEVGSVRGLPEGIMVDNGPEFISNALDEWAYKQNVKLRFSRPGKPVDNAYIESFNGRLRDECLNQHWFLSLDHARKIVNEWRMDYNEDRPHSSLGNLSPNEFARRQQEKMAEVV